MFRKIKVVHIVTQLELGGAQQNTLATVTGLDRTRYAPVLFCGQGAVLDPAARNGNFPVRFIRGLVRPVSPWRDLVALVDLYRGLRKEKPDIVHTHSSKAGVLGRIAAVLAEVPVIVHTFHGFGFTPGQNAIVRGTFVLLERILAPWTTVLIAVSSANREEALSRGIGRPSQYRLIRSGVPLDDYRTLVHRGDTPVDLPFLPSEKVVTTIGPFKPQKNLFDFIRAAQIVAARRDDVRFLIVGDGRGRAEIEREIRSRNLGPGWSWPVGEGTSPPSWPARIFFA
ncbi:MAG: glycosyltransferase [Elusimicrobia bacterium]|nr:glycosyltransferase [Elusimicrobiota bacterium]